MATELQIQQRGPGVPVVRERHDWGPGQPTPEALYQVRLIRRFWKYVDKTPGLGPWGNCWQWTGSKSKGYGQIGVRLNGKHRPIRAHAAGFRFVYGHDVPFGHRNHICHRCNNRLCVREDHLFAGTPKQNIHHAQLTGLMPIKSPRPEPSDYYIGKLTRRQYWMIRKHRRYQGVSLVDLAHLAQMDKSHLSMLERGKRPCRLSQVVFILNFLKIEPAEFGLSSCPLKPAWKAKRTTAKYLSHPPQYVYRKPAHAQHLRKQRAMWLDRMGTPRSDLYDAPAMIDAIDQAAVRQSDIRKATGLQYIDLFTVLGGHETDSDKVLAMIKYVESLKNGHKAA